MSDSKGYYKLLNVSSTTPIEEIKKKYKDKAKSCHPDKNNGSETDFIKLKEAYDTLIDPTKKSLYDRGLDSNDINEYYDETAAGFFFMGEGVYMNMDNMDNMYDNMSINDIFQNLFDLKHVSENEEFRKNQNYKSKKYSKIAVNLSLDDLIYGSTKVIKYSSYDECKKCNGEGNISYDVLRCITCNGSGFIKKSTITHLCPSCNGLSNMRTSFKSCDICSGEGCVKNKKVIEINIDPGKTHNSEETFHDERLIIKFVHDYDLNKIVQKGNDLHVYINIFIEELLCGFSRKVRIGSKDPMFKFHKDGYFDPTEEKPILLKDRGIFFRDQNENYKRGNMFLNIRVDGSSNKKKHIEKFKLAFCKIFKRTSKSDLNDNDTC